MTDAVAAPHATTRDGWIALATDGPVLALGDCVRTVGDASAFVDLLDDARPRVALVSEPPASSALLDLLTDRRRRRPRMRIVHLAAEADVAARLHALRLGFDEALPTTIDPDELLGRLELLDARARPPTSTVLPVADGVELDLVAHELRRDGRPIHLRPKEFDLLAFLAAHPGRAYSRRQLLDRAWGAAYLAELRTVDVHVRWLRSKIERDPAHPVRLVTLRGLGYRLDPPGSLTEP